jgi:hypothetical protein
MTKDNTGNIPMMKFKRLTLALAGLLFTAAVLSAQQVKTDYDHSADFSRYKTYSWVQVKTSNSLWDERVKSAVNSALAAKGLTEVASGGDIAVVASRTSKKQQTLNTFYDGLGGGWGWRRFGGGGFSESTTTTETYKVGTLVLDLFGGSSKGLLWRSSSSGTLSSNSDKNIKNLDKTVQKMFKDFPPGSSKR